MEIKTKEKEFYTLEELEDQFIGEKGTPERDAYEADMEKERNRIVQDYLDCDTTKKAIDAGFDKSWVRGEIPLALCLKWLREVHNMHVEVFPLLSPIGNGKFSIRWKYCVYSMETSACKIIKDHEEDSFYQVSLKGINYCLDVIKGNIGDCK